MDKVQMILSELLEQIQHEPSRAIVREHLLAHNQARAEQRKRADQDLMWLSSRESAELAGGSTSGRERGAPYGSRV
jgi:hypothetical protein